MSVSAGHTTGRTVTTGSWLIVGVLHNIVILRRSICPIIIKSSRTSSANKGITARLSSTCKATRERALFANATLTCQNPASISIAILANWVSSHIILLQACSRLNCFAIICIGNTSCTIVCCYKIICSSVGVNGSC